MVPNIGLFILLSFLSLFSNAVSAAEGDAQQLQLMDGAKKEGKLVFYTSVETEFARSLAAAFEAQISIYRKPTFFARLMTKSSVV